MGGGSKTQVIQPTVAAQPSTADAINAYIEGLPKMFQAQLEYAPKEAQQQLDLITQYAGPIGLALKQAQEQLYPTQTGLTEALAKQATAQMENPAPSEAEIRYINSALNAGLGTNVSSGVGKVFKAKSLMDVYNQRKQEAQNLAAVTAGLGNVANAQQPQYTNQMAQYNPGQTMNFMSNNYGAYTSASRPMVMGGSGSNTGSMIGGIAGGVGGVAMAI